MSDVVAPVAPTAPAAAPEAPIEAQSAPEQPKTAQEYLKSVQKKVWNAKASEEVVQTPASTEQPRDEQGRFAPKETQESVAQAPEAGDPAQPEHDEVAPAPEFVKIPLPDGHPLRARGQTHLTVPKEAEEYGRWAVNAAPKNAELQRALDSERQLKLQIEEANARERFWREQGTELFGPDFRKTYEDLKQAYGEEQAEVFKRGRMQQAQEKMAEALEAHRSEQQQQLMTNEARNFANQAYQFSRQRYHGWNDTQIEFALASYASMIEATGQGFDGQAFQAHADALYLRDPSVRKQAMTAQQAKQQAEVEKLANARAAELEKQRLDEYNAKRKTNPLGRTPSVATELTTPLSRPDRPKNAAEFIRNTERRAKGLPV